MVSSMEWLISGKIYQVNDWSENVYQLSPAVAPAASVASHSIVHRVHSSHSSHGSHGSHSAHSSHGSHSTHSHSSHAHAHAHADAHVAHAHRASLELDGDGDSSGVPVFVDEVDSDWVRGELPVVFMRCWRYCPTLYMP